MTDDSQRSGMPKAVRILLLVLVAALIIVLLFGWVFPWVEANIYNPSLDG